MLLDERSPIRNSSFYYYYYSDPVVHFFNAKGESSGSWVQTGDQLLSLSDDGRSLVIIVRPGDNASTWNDSEVMPIAPMSHASVPVDASFSLELDTNRSTSISELTFNDRLSASFVHRFADRSKHAAIECKLGQSSDRVRALMHRSCSTVLIHRRTTCWSKAHPTTTERSRHSNSFLERSARNHWNPAIRRSVPLSRHQFIDLPLDTSSGDGLYLTSESTGINGSLGRCGRKWRLVRAAAEHR